ncbi:hypothetical protein LZ012_02560 [Dechloromonas sp. XY25]|uniref:Zinc-dependent peptidase n=1 Tax=Dechloromonas hankyongensis TaxID=2908002 RepID=A0ABS9JYF0_9RHOO|nr:hypothetical protein [Dechloromonas hankyongensis]MCG2575874.1 hypothetical protein [Dechloromonas hankyongensis]
MVIERCTLSIASATQFLAGSTSKRIPYEIVHGLLLALRGWISRPAVITTAISQDLYRGFFFRGVDPHFHTLAEAFLEVSFEADLVQISLPQIYRHRPLYNTPLYHELGHFIDQHHGITDRSLTLYDEHWQLPGLELDSLSNASLQAIQKNHRGEYFADLFAVSFAGTAFSGFLDAFAGDSPAGISHPATAERLRVVEDFLEGKPNAVVELFQTTLSALELPNLQLQFEVPDVTEFFDNVRPYPLTSDRQVHGIFDSSWRYLENIWAHPNGHWEDLGNNDKIEQAINDLVEKSIRNRMISMKWRGHASS